MLDDRLIARAYAAAKAERWRVDAGTFATALEASAGKAFAGRRPARQDLERYLHALHLEDLALACACASGDNEAWDHFVLTHRPVLYRAADALDSTGGARDLADALYAELFGLRERGGERRSLFTYFHGRSSLATWLRAVLAQRHVDRLRTQKRSDPLPDDDSREALPAPRSGDSAERERFVSLMRRALSIAIAVLSPRDRLRLACYYAREMTLAQTGRVVGEHEATASRQLSRTRAAIRASVEQTLRADSRLTEAEIAECFASVSEDAGPLDLAAMLGERGEGEARKKSSPDRSREEGREP